MGMYDALEGVKYFELAISAVAAAALIIPIAVTYLNKPNSEIRVPEPSSLELKLDSGDSSINQDSGLNIQY
ncbi:hypothetical protein HOC01_03535 [archaeon]|nr:hypothetical protein [archaeon]MBT6698516.1 hypothetical protein [archaeon]